MLKWTHPPRVREPAVIPGAGKITAVEPDPRRKGAVRVYLDGVHRWTAALADVEDLRVGVVADAASLALLERAADTEGAYRAALKHLARRAHARGDLDRKLRRKAHPPASVAAALARLEALGLLDDLAFAKNYVETRAQRGRGPMRVKRDLQAMGVERTVVEQAIGLGWPTSVPPEELAKALAAKRLKQLGALPRQALRRRLIQYLGRRGFGGGVAGKVVGEVLGR